MQESPACLSTAGLPCTLPYGHAICYPQNALLESPALIMSPSQKPPGSPHQFREQSTNSLPWDPKMSASGPNLLLQHLLPIEPIAIPSTALFFPYASNLPFLLPIIHFLPLLPPHPSNLSFNHEEIHPQLEVTSQCLGSCRLSSMTFLQPHADLSHL